MRPWLQTILKVVVMGITMCSGIVVFKNDMPLRDEGQEGEGDIRQIRQKLDRAA